MRIDVITLFPEMFDALEKCGVSRRILQSGAASLARHDLRAFGEGPRRMVDDRPYGGGSGMVLMAAPLAQAVAQARAARAEAGAPNDSAPVVLLSPQGRVFNDALARQWARKNTGFILICGRYAGVDARFAEKYVDEELSVGDYILSGGEIAAMAVIDALLRLLPGALGNPDSVAAETFSEENGGMLAPPYHTRPEIFEGEAVPQVLLSGNHAAVAEWRRKAARAQTAKKRPDLL